MKKDFFKRVWLDFRNGHSTYLAFILAFSNTIMIVYYFLIDRIDFLMAKHEKNHAVKRIIMCLYCDIRMELMSDDWFRRRWLDFRNGHSTYLLFVLSFSNFILIAYYFLVEKIAFLNSFVPNLWVFTTIFIVVYIPSAILLGRWHRKTQYRTEITAMWDEAPLMAKSLRLLVDIGLNNASTKELESMRNFFESIEKKKT